MKHLLVVSLVLLCSCSYATVAALQPFTESTVLSAAPGGSRALAAATTYNNNNNEHTVCVGSTHSLTLHTNVTTASNVTASDLPTLATATAVVELSHLPACATNSDTHVTVSAATGVSGSDTLVFISGHAGNTTCGGVVSLVENVTSPSNGSEWAVSSTLTTPTAYAPVVNGSVVSGRGDGYGYSVAVSPVHESTPYTDHLFVGAPGLPYDANASATNDGVVFVYGSPTAGVEPTLINAINASDYGVGAGARFGASLAFGPTADGLASCLAVGAPGQSAVMLLCGETASFSQWSLPPFILPLTVPSLSGVGADVSMDANGTLVVGASDGVAVFTLSAVYDSAGNFSSVSASPATILTNPPDVSGVRTVSVVDGSYVAVGASESSVVSLYHVDVGGEGVWGLVQSVNNSVDADGTGIDVALLSPSLLLTAATTTATTAYTRTACPPGSYRFVSLTNTTTTPSGVPTCIPCDGGSSSAQFTRAASCPACLAGSVASGRGVVVCAACGAGESTNGLEGEEVCTPCGAGYYNNDTGAGNCTACPPGFAQASSSSTECLPCPVGTATAINATDVCPPCGLGEYASGEGNSVCTECERGTFANVSRLETCFPCNPGSATNLTGQWNCTQCERGSAQADPGAIVCDACAAGYEQPLVGQTACEPCQAGYYANGTGTHNCVMCDAGSYTDTVNATSCDLCPAGTYANTSAATGCEPCPVGLQSDEGASECGGCGPGQYTPTSDPSACLACSPGTASNATSTAACTPCLPGYYATGVGNIECSPCGRGTYAGGNGTDVCDPCPGGMFNNVTAAMNCSVCGIGTYNDGTGVPECTPCPAGTYGNTTQLSLCHDCDAGSASDVVGATDASTCALCPEGEIAATPGRSTCNTCGTNRYSPTVGGTACLNCPANSIAPNSGSASCYCDSENAYVSNSTGACVLCPDDVICADCSGGACVCSKRFSERADGVCVRCPVNDKGVYADCADCNNNGVCKCKSGFYLTDKGCKNCPEGASCDAAGKDPVPVEGYWASANNPYSFVQCDPPERCPGGAIGDCREGHKGFACRECNKGYAMNGLTGLCTPCGAGTTLALVGYLVFALVLGLSFYRAAYMHSAWFNAACISLEGLQLIGFMMNVNIDWGVSAYTGFLWISLSSLNPRVFSLGCAVAGGGEITYADTYPLALMFPVIVVLVLTALLIAVAAVVACVGKNPKRAFQAVFSCFLAMLGYIYTPMLAVGTDGMRCYERLDGKLVWKYDRELECGDLDGWQYTVLAWGLSVSAVYALFVPLLHLTLLCCCARKSLVMPGTRGTFGLIFQRFSKKRWWAGPLFLLRNGLFHVFPAFLVAYFSKIAWVTLLAYTISCMYYALLTGLLAPYKTTDRVYSRMEDYTAFTLFAIGVCAAIMIFRDIVLGPSADSADYASVVALVFMGLFGCCCCCSTAYKGYVTPTEKVPTILGSSGKDDDEEESKKDKKKNKNNASADGGPTFVTTEPNFFDTPGEDPENDPNMSVIEWSGSDDELPMAGGPVGGPFAFELEPVDALEDALRREEEAAANATAVTDVELENM